MKIFIMFIISFNLYAIDLISDEIKKENVILQNQIEKNNMFLNARNGLNHSIKPKIDSV